MTIKKIEEVYLYVSEAAGTAAESIEAIAFMENSGVPFIKLMYNDAAQLPAILSVMNGWWVDRLPPLETFPFVTYVEVHDNIPARASPIQYLEGIEKIKTIVSIYSINAL